MTNVPGGFVGKTCDVRYDTAAGVWRYRFTDKNGTEHTGEAEPDENHRGEGILFMVAQGVANKVCTKYPEVTLTRIYPTDGSAPFEWPKP